MHFLSLWCLTNSSVSFKKWLITLWGKHKKKKTKKQNILLEKLKDSVNVSYQYEYVNV
jgi:hypothetical protein